MSGLQYDNALQNMPRKIACKEKNPKNSFHKYITRELKKEDHNHNKESEEKYPSCSIN